MEVDDGLSDDAENTETPVRRDTSLRHGVTISILWQNLSMRRGTFPDPLTYDFPEWTGFGSYLYPSRDIVDFGAPLTEENLREAYQKGIFPWPTDGLPLPWHCPERRAILEFADLHVTRTLRRERQKTRLRFTIDQEFGGVVAGCGLVQRPDQLGTWITDEYVDAFFDLHEAGIAHSVEVWDARDQLVGGLYGVDAEGVFCGESMFYIVPNASKLALLFLIDHLRSRGSTWLDCQVMTPHFQTFGAVEIERHEFLQKLKKAQAERLVLFTDNR